MAALSYAEQVQQAYLAYYGRPADPAGQQYWVNQLTAANGNLNSIINAFGNSAESTALYGGSSTAAQVNAIYQTLFGRAADVTGLNFYVNGIVSGQFTLASVALNIYNGATGTDATELTAKLGYADSFTAALSQSVAGQVAYSGNAAASNARAAVASVVDSTSQATATAALSTTIANIGTGSVAQTFTLTTGVDTLTGTNGSDVFVVDNTAGVGKYVTSPADSINGNGGNDTLKIYSDGTAAGQVLPTLNGVANLWINNAGLDVDASKLAGVTSLQIDAPKVGALNFTVAGQALTLSNEATGGLSYTVKSTVDTSESITVSKFGKGVVAATSDTIDLNGAKVASATITSTGGANNVTLTNTGGALTTLNIAGDKALTLTESIGTLKTINASGDLGGVSVDTSGVAKLAGFAFTGGSGNDTLTLKAGDLSLLTSGSQLDGGAGSNTLAVQDTALATTDYTALNASKNFSVVGLGLTTGAQTVDASQLTSIHEFAIGNSTGLDTISNLGTNGIVDITGNAAVTLTGAVGTTGVTLNIGNATSTGITTGALTLTGLSNVAIASNGTNVAANALGTLVNSDNSSIKVTGSNDLSFTLAAGSSTGDKVDASAFTGKLTVTGSAQGDILIGGSGADTFNTGAKSTTITGGAGNDVFNVAASKAIAGGAAANTVMSTITDASAGDTLKMAALVEHFSSAAVNVSTATTLAAAITMASTNASTAVTDANVHWFQFGGNTYVVENVGTAAATTDLGANDLVVKLAGVHDLSKATFTGHALALA